MKIRIYDTEVSNHYYRKSKGSNNLTNKCYIPIDAEQFAQNKLGIKKRSLICQNNQGMIIESGYPTLDFICKNHIYDKYIGWFKNELI